MITEETTQIIDDVPAPEPDVVDEQQGAPEQEPEEPAYEPNYSYNIKSEERTFDERLHGIITSKENEDYIRDLVTKAEGLDTYKTKLSEKEQSYSEMQERYNEVETGFKNYEKGIQRLEELKNTDLSSFARAWGISDQQILDLARGLLDENPQAKAQRESQFNSVVQGWQQHDQQAQQQAYAQQESARLHDMEMTIAFQDSKVSDFEKAYDMRAGKEGAFREQVNVYGSSQWNMGNQLRPSQCVKAVMDQFGVFVTPQNPSQPQAAPQGTANPLPNMGSGKTGSPVSKKLSWSDLKTQAGLNF